MNRHGMTALVAGLLAVIIGGAAAFARTSQDRSSSTSQDARASLPVVSEAEYERWKNELSNWGRWGKDDQLGTLNLITPSKRKKAAALVREGVTVSMARYWPTGGPEGDLQDAKGGATDVNNQYDISNSGNRVELNIHGMAQTHFDYLSHTFVGPGGRAYNGYLPDKASIEKEGRHARNGVEHARQGIVTRGILMDIPRLKGVAWLEPGTPITAADLDAWEKKAGVKVTAGDAIFIRTGRWARRAQVGPWYPGRSKNGTGAGLDPTSVLPWLKKRDVAILGADASPYLQPPPVPYLGGAIHDFSIAVMGMPGIDVCDLEDLAKEAAARNRWEFLLMTAPLPLRGATGSPVNPIAVF